MKSPLKIADKNGAAEFVARAQRAMQRAGKKAMADYKRFGIEPVISNPTKQHQEPIKR